MPEHQSRPSAVERLQAEHPDALLWRDLLDDGSHGDWVAELRLTIRCRDVEALRALLERAYALGQTSRPPVCEGAGGGQG